jgi:uncharacterized protein YndB with AHSA1/START domain
MMTPQRDALVHSLDRSVLICAPRATVFRYFTDSERFAAWWGAGSSIEPRPGGALRIRYPNGIEALGEVLEIRPPERIVFSYGYAGDNPAIEPGGSQVTVTLDETAAGTRVHLRHELASAPVRDEHVQGWRYQLSVFANVVAREAHADAGARVDRFFALWREQDAGRRAAELAEIATPDLAFHDAFSATAGREDLVAHIGAAQFHMPHVVLEREGAVQTCQGVAIARWIVRAPDGSERGRGANVFELAPDGRIAKVTGLWGAG